MVSIRRFEAMNCLRSRFHGMLMRREWNSLLEWGVGLTGNHGLRGNKPFLKPQVDASPDRRTGDAATGLARAKRDVGSKMMVAMKAMTVVDLIVAMAATATKETIEPSEAMKVMTANAEITLVMHAPSTNAIPSSTDSLNGSAVRTLGGTAFTGSSRPLNGQGRSLLTTHREHIYRCHKLPRIIAGVASTTWRLTRPSIFTMHGLLLAKHQPPLRMASITPSLASSSRARRSEIRQRRESGPICTRLCSQKMVSLLSRVSCTSQAARFVTNM